MSIATHSTRNCQADRNSVLTGSGTALFMLGVLLGLALLACGNDGSLFGSSNHAPRADAGQDQQVNVGASVILDGDGSDDPDGDPIQYAWAFITGPVWVSVDSAGMPRAHVRLPVDGTFEFRLTVVDERGASDQADVRVVALPDPTRDLNHQPQAVAGPDFAARVGQEVALDGSVSSDADGDSLSFLWVQVGGPGVILRDGDQRRARVEFAEPGQYGFRLVVVDAHGSSSSDQLTITVSGAPAPPPNESPVADAGPSMHVFAGDTVTLDGRASSDPDGDTLIWSWDQISGPTSVRIVGPTASTATVTLQLPGVYTFRLIVADQQAQATAQVRITAAARVGSIEVEGVFEGAGP
jgi:hypothetical protein